MQQSKYFESDIKSDIGLGGAEICGFVAAYLGFELSCKKVCYTLFIYSTYCLWRELNVNVIF